MLVHFQEYLSINCTKINLFSGDLNIITNKRKNDCLHTDLIFVQTSFHPHGYHQVLGNVDEYLMLLVRVKSVYNVCRQSFCLLFVINCTLENGLTVQNISNFYNEFFFSIFWNVT
jgi:SPX domain protein involved in polyphosphate accumulation